MEVKNVKTVFIDEVGRGYIKHSIYLEINGIRLAKIIQRVDGKYEAKMLCGLNTPYQWGVYCSLTEAKNVVAQHLKTLAVDPEKLEQDDGDDDDLIGRKPKSVRMKELPFAPDAEFYPTPSSLAGKMVGMVDWKQVQTILEPSAGKGDLIDAIRRYGHRTFRFRDHWTYANTDYDIDCIEKDENLRYILQGKKERVVADDFLLYSTRKQYDLIIMNPPFSNGDEHLLRAIEMQEPVGGQIVSLLNAETLLNPCTNRRKVLLDKLSRHKARIEYVQNAFAHAERKTDITVAIVYINIPKAEKDSEFYSRIKKAYDSVLEETGSTTELAPNSKFETLVRLYEIETAATQDFFEEYNALTRKITNSYTEDGFVPFVLKIGKYEIGKEGVTTEDMNRYMRSVRSKYWHMLFRLPEITNRLTSAAQRNWEDRINELQDYEFSEFNVKRVMIELQGQLIEDIEAAIMSVFEKLSCEHAYGNDFGNNIHYYNGWKTNKAHKVNNKVIIPAYGAYSSWGNGFQSWDAWRILEDIEKSLDYLNGRKESDTTDTLASLQAVNGNHSASNIRCKYFSVTFYKKGTCHIKFYPEAQPVLDALNIFASRNRGWLPPSYGKVRYSAMEKEDRDVVDEFQGKKAYDQVMDHPELYLFEKGERLLLA